MVSNRRLALIAAYGLLGISALGKFVEYRLQNSVSNSLCYKEAMKCLCDHPEAQQHLGEPILGGRINLGDDIRNGTDQDQLRYTIPVKGSKSTGSMTYYVTKVNEADRNYKVYRIELDVDHIKDKTLLIKK